MTIGSFDGVHLGHQAILEQVKLKAKALNVPSVVMVFEPQPQEFFSGEKAPARLMRLREKVETLRELGIDQVVCLQFNSALRRLTAEEFVSRVLVNGLSTRYLIVGDDFRFGCDRSGDFAMLRKAGEHHDFEVQDTDTLEVDGRRVSSTLVRQVLSQSRTRLVLTFCEFHPEHEPCSHAPYIRVTKPESQYQMFLLKMEYILRLRLQNAPAHENLSGNLHARFAKHHGHGQN